jgi:hypothetical protein
MTRSPARIGVEVSYLVATGALATAGGVTQHWQYYIAAVLLTLPFGLAALAGVYLGYALIQAVGGLFLATTTAGGDEAAWLATASASLDVVLLMAAALGNLVLLRYLSGRSAGRPAFPRQHLSPG